MPFSPWQKIHPPSRDFSKWASSALQELGQVLQEWRKLLEFGPIQGAYYPIQLHRHIPAGLSAVSVASKVLSVSQMRVIEVTAWVDTGQLTLKVHSGAGEVLGSTVVTSAGVVKNASGDFTTQSIPMEDALWLEIVSIDSGTPLEVTVKVTAKALSKVEPA